MAHSGRLSNLIRASPGLTLATPARGTVGTEQYVGGEPRFNINSIAAETVKAVEVYRSTAQIPVEFNRLGNYCGLVVIWFK